jgi:glyoxylase-like metal-dependent hydrolase (beta-lactamase superfamily II)
VITHPNPDKFNGASVFKKEGAKILASENTAKAIPDVHAYKEYYFVEMAKMFPKGQYPQPTLIDQTFIGKMDLVLQGGERIQFQELSHAGVSSTQTVAYIKTAQTLIVGDLIHNQAHAWLEGGIVKGKPTPNIEEWILDLQELESLYPKSTNVLGGRGVSLKLKESVKEQTKYLRIARELVRQQLNEMDPKDSQFYKVLAQKFQKQFPNYTLPYMIEYGAYGLVQSELSVK